MRILLLLLLALTSAPLSVSGAEDSQARGEAIAREADLRDRGFGDNRTVLTMILQDRKGRTRERRLRIDTLEVPDETRGDKSLVVFETPRDMKGTALLSHAQILEDDDQWLFLPALKRVKRISSANKTSSFFGSEFAYEDITGQELGKYAYKWLSDDVCGELDCYVVERLPLFRNSGYSRLVTWYDTAEYRVQRIDYYDHKETLLKTLTLSGYRQYLGRFWRAQTYTMENFRTGKTTRLIYDVYKFQTGLTEEHFRKGNLRRVE
ncbi:MAG: outer membrane lipoprotein-sorting protein [Paracoccaceae bacterium]|nr:outer membrane lipoprotein-sorting protein [Paracoccaceae bacterium]